MLHPNRFKYLKVICPVSRIWSYSKESKTYSKSVRKTVMSLICCQVFLNVEQISSTVFLYLCF